MYNPTWLMDPHCTALYKVVGAGGSWYEVDRRVAVPIVQTLTRSRGERSQRREAAIVFTVGLTAPPLQHRTSPTLPQPSLPVCRASPTERDGRILLDSALRWSVHSHLLFSLYHSVVRFIRFSTCSSQIQRTTRLDATLGDLWDLTSDTSSL